MCNHYFTWKNGEVIVSVGTAEMVIGYAKTDGEYQQVCTEYCSEC